MGIIISQDGKNAVKLERSVIEQEDFLQRYICDNPDTLPLHELKDDPRLLILAREFPTASGPLDALGVDADGDLYIIETKLYKNPDKRRVIAQMLDYGAALWSEYGGDTGAFLAKLEEAGATRQGAALAERLRGAFGLGPEALTDYLAALEQNLSQGAFRFVVLMDRLDQRLKDLITFVNTNSRFDILGVELDFYKHQQFEIIIPNLYGAERRKEVGNPPAALARKTWDEGSFFEHAESVMSGEELRSVRGVYEWCRAKADRLNWGRGGKTGSFNPVFEHVHPSYALFSVYSNGTLEIKFPWFTEEPGSRFATALGRVLLEEGILPLSPSDLARRPNLPIEQWNGRSREFLEVVERVIFADSASLLEQP